MDAELGMGHACLGDRLISVGDDSEHFDRPALREVSIQLDEVLAAADPLAGVRPLADEVVGQELADAVPVAGLDPAPELRHELVPRCHKRDYHRSVLDREEIRAPGLAEPFSHYTDAVRVGGLLFISGCVAIDERGEVVGAGDVVAQARQVFTNLGLVLEAAGASFADVAKVTHFLTNVDDRTLINPVRQEFFGEARPASTLVEVSALVLPELLIEVEAIARVPSAEL